MSDIMLELLRIEAYGFVVLVCLFFIFLAIALAFMIVLTCFENSKFHRLVKIVNTITDEICRAARMILIGIAFDVVVFFMTGIVMFLIMFIESAIV